MLLEVQNVTAGYSGGPDILRGLTMGVEKGKSYCVIGPNGAGKSTLLRVICGLLHPRQGQVLLNGEPVHHLRTDQILMKGISFVPQDRSLFPDMTVRENLRMGGYILNNRKDVDRRIDSVYELFPLLKERGSQLAKTLSGGQQQMLSIGRSLVLRPEIIMLDEPSLGLAPKIAWQIFDSIQFLIKSGMTVILVEQNARMGLQSVEWGFVLDLGKMSFEGAAQDILHDKRIQELYLGRSKMAIQGEA